MSDRFVRAKRRTARAPSAALAPIEAKDLARAWPPFFFPQLSATMFLRAAHAGIGN
jgi:hypothetical protein